MIAYRSRLAFWSGVLAVSIGAVLHLSTYVERCSWLMVLIETRRRRLEDTAPT